MLTHALTSRSSRRQGKLLFRSLHFALYIFVGLPFAFLAHLNSVMSGPIIPDPNPLPPPDPGIPPVVEPPDDPPARPRPAIDPDDPAEPNQM